MLNGSRSSSSISAHGAGRSGMTGVRRTSQRKDHYVVVFMFSSLLS